MSTGSEAPAYEYDAVTHALPTRITDAHGYSPSATHDLRFGELATTTDVNGKITTRTYDKQGRLSQLDGPPSGTTKLVTVEYESLTGPPAHPGTAWARTHNWPAAGATDSIDTVVIVDGLKRVLQTKKTAEVADGGLDEGVMLGWSATGQQRFDAMGRVNEQGLTYFEPGSVSAFVPAEIRFPTVTNPALLGSVGEQVAEDGVGLLRRAEEEAAFRAAARHEVGDAGQNLTGGGHGAGPGQGVCRSRVGGNRWDPTRRLSASRKSWPRKLLSVDYEVTGRARVHRSPESRWLPISRAESLHRRAASFDYSRSTPHGPVSVDGPHSGPRGLRRK